MTFNFKEEVKKEDRFCGGHRMCAGCGAPITIKNVLRALNPEDKAVVCSATSCLEVSTFMYPFTSWKDSFIHNAFENAGATISGVETAYRALKKRGKINDTYKFIAFGGDGGTYDIGFQSLSGARLRPSWDFSTGRASTGSLWTLPEYVEATSLGLLTGTIALR